MESGIIIDWFLHNETSLRIAPPLIITDAQIKTACEIILQALD
jgi:4-aminobutyrate aminotransferase-like enzyme